MQVVSFHENRTRVCFVGGEFSQKVGLQVGSWQEDDYLVLLIMRDGMAWADVGGVQRADTTGAETGGGLDWIYSVLVRGHCRGPVCTFGWCARCHPNEAQASTNARPIRRVLQR